MIYYILPYILLSYLFLFWVAYHDSKVAKTSISEQIYPAHVLAPIFAPVVLGHVIFKVIFKRY